jgi:hypothetical protein
VRTPVNRYALRSEETVSGRNIGQRPVLLSGQDAWGLGLDVRAACVRPGCEWGSRHRQDRTFSCREWLDHLNPFGGGPTEKSAAAGVVV